jgi:predicted translin family RNA/ssDNA-binding protein
LRSCKIAPSDPELPSHLQELVKRLVDYSTVFDELKDKENSEKVTARLKEIKKDLDEHDGQLIELRRKYNSESMTDSEGEMLEALELFDTLREESRRMRNYAKAKEERKRVWRNWYVLGRRRNAVVAPLS